MQVVRDNHCLHFTTMSHPKHLVWANASAPHTVHPKKYAHGFCFAVLCCDYKLTDFPISIRLTSLALWQSNNCPSASKATLMNMDKYFMWIHYERLHNHNKAKHNETVCIFLGIYCNVLFVVFPSTSQLHMAYEFSSVVCEISKKVITQGHYKYTPYCVKLCRTLCFLITVFKIINNRQLNANIT